MEGSVALDSRSTERQVNRVLRFCGIKLSPRAAHVASCSQDDQGIRPALYQSSSFPSLSLRLSSCSLHPTSIMQA